jgi:hypothetical protein
VTRATAVESEDEFVEIALEVFPSQAVVDAERPGLQVGEDAMDPGQHDMGAAIFADDMGSGDVGRGIGCPSVGFDGCALSQVGGAWSFLICLNASFDKAGGRCANLW